MEPFFIDVSVNIWVMVIIIGVIITNKRIGHFPMVFMLPLLSVSFWSTWSYFRLGYLIKGFFLYKSMVTRYPSGVHV